MHKHKLYYITADQFHKCNDFLSPKATINPVVKEVMASRQVT